MGKKCEPGCTCGHHKRVDYRRCEPGCQCGHHRPHTDEHRRKNSEGNRGRVVTPESQAKRVATRLARGSYHTPEAMERIQAARTQAVRDDPTKSPKYKDGRSYHPQYQRWYNMMDRCHWSPVKGYGGRGITVCDEWHDPLVFYAYLETLGPCPTGYSIDRIDNDGHYEPGNIRWASQSEQNANRAKFTRSK